MSTVDNKITIEVQATNNTEKHALYLHQNLAEIKGDDGSISGIIDMTATGSKLIIYDSKGFGQGNQVLIDLIDIYNAVMIGLGKPDDIIKSEEVDHD